MKFGIEWVHQTCFGVAVLKVLVRGAFRLKGTLRKENR